VGWLKQASAANDWGMSMLTGLMLLGGQLALSMPVRLVNKSSALGERCARALRRRHCTAGAMPGQTTFIASALAR
jgi:hypothetical protein